MTKENLEKYNEQLNKILHNFLSYESDYKYGKNKKIRGDAERNMKLEIQMYEMMVRRDGELYDLATSPHGTDLPAQARGEIFHDSLRINYFDHDLKGLLRRIDEQIKNNNNNE